VLFEVLFSSSSLICEPIKFWENYVSPEVDFELNSSKTVFLEFSRKEAVFGKTNYSPFSFSLRPIYEQNMSEIDFPLVPPKVDINLLLTEREGRTGEYWPEVMAVRTERSKVRTKATEGQYSLVRSRASEVSKKFTIWHLFRTKQHFR